MKVDFGLINRSRDLEGDDRLSRRDSMKLLIGDVKDKVGIGLRFANKYSHEIRRQVVILVDDMIDTGSTIAMAAKTLKDNGAGKIYCLISHGQSPIEIPCMVSNYSYLVGLLAEANMATIAALPIERLVVCCPHHIHC